MKNWGTRIAVLYLGFVALIAVLVTMSMRQKTDLVSKDYYAQELAYQQKLDKMNRTRTLDEPVKWVVQNDRIQLQFPSGIQLPVKGTVTLFCASDAGKDLVIPFEARESTFALSLQKVVNGRYTLQLDWQAGEQTYYQEGAVQLP
jgi:hypothetical protein